MNSQKGFIAQALLILIALVVFGGGYTYYKNNGVKTPPLAPVSTTTIPIVGNDRDVHGCIGSAGYSWCAVKNKCLRVWEEKCEVATVTATTSTPIYACQSDSDCMELSCPASGGFVHEKCISGKCILSDITKKNCSNSATTTTVLPCPQYMPPAPGFCTGGSIISGGKDANGCTLPPVCQITDVYCTADAMQCPDGTYVGRSGPKCEFVCPN